MTPVPISMFACLRADGRQQRKRRGELAGEMMHAEIGAVGAELLRRDREVDRLQQGVAAERVCDWAMASSDRRRGSRFFSSRSAAG